MNFKGFIEKSSKFSDYPYKKTCDGLDYCIIGLCGNIGNCFSLLNRCIYNNCWIFVDEDVDKFKLQLGSISWYLSQILFELTIKTKDLDKDLLEYQENLVRKFKKTALDINSFDNKIKIMKHVLSAAYIKSANILNIFNNLEIIELDDKNIEKCLKEIGKLTFEVLNSIIIFSDIIGVQYMNILKENIKLLQKRKENDSIKGSGDGVDNRD